jgi:Alginate export
MSRRRKTVGLGGRSGDLAERLHRVAMRRRGKMVPLAGLVALAWMASGGLALAELSGAPLPQPLSITASMRTRWELWNWFEPKGAENNDYDFLATVVRLGATWNQDAFDVVVEAQNPALIDLPTTAVAPAPEGALGLGAVYQQQNRARNDASVFLKQGYVTLKRLGVTGLTLKGGRFEFSEGSEVLPGEPTLDWLRNVRIGQRLIGPFNFSHVGRAFDGAAVAFTRTPVNVTATWFRPTQGGFDLAGMKEIDDIDVVYAALNLLRPAWAERSDARLFYIYYEDRRHQVKSDNRPLPLRQDPGERRRDIALHTGGAHVLHVQPTGAGPVDFLSWGVLQGGDWGALDHFAWAWDLEVGWQPAALPWKPWLRAGFGRSSGDDDPSDGDHGTFFQILPTARQYSFSTFYNLMNNEDGFLEVILRPAAGLSARTAFHNLRVTESRDLWYQGAGATLEDANRPEGFGFPGRPANGRRDLFQVLETSLSYDWSRHVNTSLYYGHVFGGGIVRGLFQGDDADFGYLELTLRL